MGSSHGPAVSAFEGQGASGRLRMVWRRRTKYEGRRREDRSTGRIREGMTKESAGYRCDVQRQVRAAAVDLAVRRDRSVADSVRRLAGLLRPVDRRHGSLGAPGVI